ncbi:hypothetical protein Tco_0236034 [Tanacetum coccineum]
MAPKRATRSTPGTENLTTTTVTNAQLQAMIDQGVTAALGTEGVVGLTQWFEKMESVFSCMGTDVVTYNQRFQRTGTNVRSDVSGRGQDKMPLSSPTKLMDKKISTLAERQVENKRKLDNNNQTQNNFPQEADVCSSLRRCGLVKLKESMLGLLNCATSASFIITMARAL